MVLRVLILFQSVISGSTITIQLGGVPETLL